MNYWTMTPSDYGLLGMTRVWYQKESVTFFFMSNTVYAIRPVINVSISGDFLSGDGTSENPYIIE